MDRNTLLIALGFAALAALFVGIGFRGQERRVEAHAEMELEAQGGAAQDAGWNGGLTREDRNTIALLCSLASLASYLWILVCAFREHLGWGVAVLLGSGIGAVVFTVFHPRQSLLPLFLMFGGLGVSWAARFAGAA